MNRSSYIKRELLSSTSHYLQAITYPRQISSDFPSASKPPKLHIYVRKMTRRVTIWYIDPNNNSSVSGELENHSESERECCGSTEARLDAASPRAKKVGVKSLLLPWEAPVSTPPLRVFSSILHPHLISLRFSFSFFLIFSSLFAHTLIIVTLISFLFYLLLLYFFINRLETSSSSSPPSLIFLLPPSPPFLYLIIITSIATSSSSYLSSS